jgi:hypothetical protein
MQEVDGFTLIDYIKSSIEILMNMKIDDNDNKTSTYYKPKKAPKKDKKKDEFNEIPKIDD